MSPYFEVDSEGLDRAQAPFRDLSAALSMLSTQVQNRVSSLGNVWGDDKAGAAFATSYSRSRNLLLEGLGGTAEVVRSTADGVATMAAGFGRTEDGNTAAAEALLTRVNAAGEVTSTGPDFGRRGRVATPEPPVAP